MYFIMQGPLEQIIQLIFFFLRCTFMFNDISFGAFINIP